VRDATKQKLVLWLVSYVPLLSLAVPFAVIVLAIPVSLVLGVFGVSLHELLGRPTYDQVLAVCFAPAFVGLVGSYTCGRVLAWVFFGRLAGKLQYALEEIEVGTMTVRSGSVTIGDGVHDGRRSVTVEVTSGEYAVSVMLGRLDSWSRVAGVRISNGEPEEPVHVEQGEVRVDSAKLMIVDSKLAAAGKDVAECFKRVCTDAGEEERYCLVTDDAGCARGIITETGVGDGTYPLLIARGGSGRCALQSIFIEEEGEAAKRKLMSVPPGTVLHRL